MKLQNLLVLTICGMIWAISNASSITNDTIEPYATNKQSLKNASKAESSAESQESNASIDSNHNNNPTQRDHEVADTSGVDMPSADTKPDERVSVSAYNT